jgi:hypothetical protein
MSTTLSNGFVLPEDGDQGDSLFTALEGNITQLNGHTHDGIDSNLLSPKNLASVEQSVLLAAWVTFGGPTGHYRQTVTVPAGFDFDEVNIQFRTTAGAYIHPTIERVTDTTYYVYTTDNTIDFKAFYGN